MVFWIETVRMWRIAALIAFNILCQYGTNSFAYIFVGHIGDVKLSAVTISLSVIGTFSFGFMGRVYLLGIYMQRSWIILSVTCITLLPVYIYATPILKILGLHDEITDLAGEFTLQIIPQLFSLAINFPTQKFLQAQSKVSALPRIGFIALIIHIGLLWLFIMGHDRCSLAQVLYVFWFCKEGWRGLSWSTFRDIWAFVRLSLASVVMLCMEIWYMMSMIILTGHLDNAVIAIPFLYGAVRVSNQLGLGHPRAAKYCVYVTVFQSLLIGLLCMAAILLTRDHFSIIFTSSKKLQEAVVHPAYLLAATMVLNSVQPVISGVAVGGGWQALVAFINLGCYYLFGLPLGFFLGYSAKLGVMGGMICGTALQTLLLLLVLYKTNWKKEVEQTTERMRKWGGHWPRHDAEASSGCHVTAKSHQNSETSALPRDGKEGPIFPWLFRSRHVLFFAPLECAHRKKNKGKQQK
ncbi:hypothetical protein BT93_E0629 [Corymbia citriodora subsp. variegata]|nr:hypothetical protein BT93_E0629 [Corymbia citriodora subsp. variegata]